MTYPESRLKINHKRNFFHRTKEKKKLSYLSDGEDGRGHELGIPLALRLTCEPAAPVNQQINGLVVALAVKVGQEHVDAQLVVPVRHQDRVLVVVVQVTQLVPHRAAAYYQGTEQSVAPLKSCEINVSRCEIPI